MLHKVNRKSRGKRGVVEYYLDERVLDGTAYVLRGNPEITKALIRNISRKHKYLSGGLMFSKEDEITKIQEQEIINDFEQMLLTGLDSSQYNILWIKHIDKGRVELNYVVPRVELSTGKDLDLYSHRRDMPLMDMWQSGVNTKYGFTDPHDPRRERTVSERAKTAREERTNGSIVANRKSLDAILHKLVQKGSIQNREHMIELLTKSGYQITRKNDESISVKHPDIGKKALKLRGGIYSANFRSIRDVGEVRAERERRIKKYDTDVSQRSHGRGRTAYQRYLQTRTERHQKRYPLHSDPTQRAGQSHSEKSQDTKKRNSDDLVAKNGFENERRVDDRVRKPIEESSEERARNKKRARERARATLEAIREHNETVSRELTSSYNQSLKYFTESERTIQEQVAAAEQESLAGVRSNADVIDQQAGTFARIIQSLRRGIERVGQSIQGVKNELEKLKLFKTAKEKEVSRERPNIRLTPWS